MKRILVYLFIWSVCASAHAYTIDTLSNCTRLSEGEREVYIYHGIRYGQAERFQTPTMVEWQADSSYIKPGPVCPQYRPELGLRSSEDCLVLTINSPKPVSELATADYPVLVHIHGGSYRVGSGENSYSQLAEFTLQEQIVTVTISYRLGAFGYLYMPEMGSENLGLQDQLLALEWVRRYIGLWGGDKDRITLSGQSAGAQSVVFILAEKERIPIERALVLSAPMGNVQGKFKAKRNAKKMQAQLPEGDLGSCSSEELLYASLRFENELRTLGMEWMPTALRQKPLRTEGIQWPKQVVVTCQADDASMFVGGSRFWEPLATGVAFTIPCKSYVRYLKRRGVDATYHLFTWKPAGQKFGAMHCAELPLFLGTPYMWKWVLADVTPDELLPMRTTFMHQLGEFVRTGRFDVSL